MGGSAAETIRQPRDRLRGQPQERQHSAARRGTRDRLPPASGTLPCQRLPDGCGARRRVSCEQDRDRHRQSDAQFYGLSIAIARGANPAETFCPRMPPVSYR